MQREELRVLHPYIEARYELEDCIDLFPHARVDMLYIRN